MTSTTASCTANGDSARGATQALSVEQFNGSHTIGTLVTQLPTTTTTSSTPTDQCPTTAPTYRQLGQAVADRIATEMPTFAAKFPSAELANLMADVLRQATSTRRSAACPDWCVTNHTVDTDPGWHQGAAIDVTCSVASLNAVPGEPLETLLSACVTQHSEDPDAFGIETRIWLDTGMDTTELDVAQTDQLITGLETFLPKLRAMRDYLVEARAGDHPGSPTVKAARMAEVDARVKAINAAEAARS